MIPARGFMLGSGGRHAMKNIPNIVAIILLLSGIGLMLGEFPFEAGLPEWTSQAAIATGLLLALATTLMSRRNRA